MMHIGMKTFDEIWKQNKLSCYTQQLSGPKKTFAKGLVAYASQNVAGYQTA